MTRTISVERLEKTLVETRSKREDSPFDFGWNSALRMINELLKSGAFDPQPSEGIALTQPEQKAMKAALYDSAKPASDGIAPCPFCGREPKKHSNGVMVQCPTIPCPMNAGWTFIEHWNVRSPAQPEGLPDWLLAIGERLRTQDNRITSEPLFCVFQKRRIYGLDPAYGGDNWVWLQLDEGCEVDASEVELDEYEEPVNDIFQRIYYQDVDVFVTAHLTEEAANHHIRINGHNLKKPFTYVTSQYRCPEYIQLRQWLMSLPQPPTPEHKEPS